MTQETGTKNIEKKVVLHISHTDIRTDSRILKELESHHRSGFLSVVAIGVAATNENPVTNTSEGIGIRTLDLVMNSKKWRPRLIRHLFTFVELFLRTFRSGIKMKPDVVHCHDTLVLPIGVFIKIFTGCKLVYDAHELESDKNGQSVLLSKATLYIEKACWKKVDLLVSVSESILNWYNENIGPKKNTLILNSPSIAKNDVNFNNNYFHEKFSIPKDRLVFVYLGILGQGRGIEHILDAFSSDEIKSHVVFMGFGEFSEKIESVAQLKPNVHLHEAVNHDQVVKLTSSASVGLCFIENISLSDYYCLPNKLFEYAFSGIPILASSFPDIKQCIEKYQLGYCSDVDSQSILEAIKKYEKTPTKLIDSDLYELSWECQSKRLVNSYKELLR